MKEWILFRILIVCLIIQTAVASCPTCIHGSCSSGATVCTCLSGWVGVDCSLSDTTLSSGVTLSNQHVDYGEWKFYHLTTSAVDSLYWDLEQTSSVDADCDLYIQLNAVPSRTFYFARDITTAQHVQINTTSVSAGVWYAGVYGFQPCTYSFKVTLGNSCPNSCSGHGQCNNGVCTCSSGYTGNDCSSAIATLSPNTAVTGTVATGSWRYYTLQGSSAWHSFDIVLTQTTSGDGDLYVRRGLVLPTQYSFDFANVSSAMISYVNVSSPQTMPYSIGVYGFNGCSYSLKAVVYSSTTPTQCQNQCSLHGTCSSNTCVCNTGYSGTQCESLLTPMQLSTRYSGFVGDNAWNYYHITLQTSNSVLVAISQSASTPNGDCDLYIKQGTNPTRTSYDFLDLSSSANFSVSIAHPGIGTWYIGLFGWYPCGYTMTITETTTCGCASDGHGSCSAGSTACICQTGWSGPGCNRALVPLSNGVNLAGQSVGMNQWAYYQISTSSSYFQVAIREDQNTAGPNPYGNLWLFVSKTGDFPTLTTYDDADQTPAVSIHYADFAYPTSESYTYVIGVYGNVFINSPTNRINYQIVAWSPPR